MRRRRRRDEGRGRRDSAVYGAVGAEDAECDTEAGESDVLPMGVAPDLSPAESSHQRDEGVGGVDNRAAGGGLDRDAGGGRRDWRAGASRRVSRLFPGVFTSAKKSWIVG